MFMGHFYQIQCISHGCGSNTFKSIFPGASLTGCTATVKTTAAMGLMSLTRIVLPVWRRVTGSARTGGVSPRGGSATSRTTAGTTLMRARKCAREGTGSARNQSSPATTGSASLQGNNKSFHVF